MENDPHQPLKITAISAQRKNANRVNISVDGVYRFSLDMFQVVDLGIRVGKEYTETELTELEDESVFGKLYSRALEYCLMRPHSAKEVREYLWRKTQATRKKDGSQVSGASKLLTERVYMRLLEKGYIDDEKFTSYWVENRSLTKGMSRRKLMSELRAKGIDAELIERAFQASERSDKDELNKVIEKKRSRYPDNEKFIQYLMRQGFRYDDIQSALERGSDQ